MAMMENYDSQVTENKRLIGDANYEGYLDGKARKSTAKVFTELANNLSRLKGRLKEHSNKVAKAHSISTFNLYNDIVKDIEKLSQSVKDEKDCGFYNLTDLNLDIALDILQMDKDLFQRFAELKTTEKTFEKKESTSEDDIAALNDNMQSFKEMANRRQQKIFDLADTYKGQVEKVANIGHLIDQRNLNEATTVAESIFSDQLIFLEPVLDLVEHLRSRQLFHARRLESGLQRDEQSLLFFDLYVTILQSLKNLLHSEQENLVNSPYKIRAEQEVEKLENVKDKRDDLYSKASPREVTVEEDKTEIEAKSKLPLIATVAIIVVVILAVILFVF